MVTGRGRVVGEARETQSERERSRPAFCPVLEPWLAVSCRKKSNWSKESR